MIQEKIFIYESPQVKTIELQVEQVLATSFEVSYGTSGIGEEDGEW